MPGTTVYGVPYDGNDTLKDRAAKLRALANEIDPVVSPPPAPPPPPPAPVESTVGLVITGKAGEQIIDNAGIAWTLNTTVRNGSIARAGVDDPVTADVASLTYQGAGVIRQTHKDGRMWVGKWNGTAIAWTAIAVTQPVPPPAPPPVNSPTPTFAEFPKLVFEDKFTSFNPAVWRKNTFFGEMQFETDRVSIVDGALQIRATSDGRGGGASGYIDTRGSGLKFQNGYFEVEGLFNGPANWDAGFLWLWGQDDAGLPKSGGEFDIIESLSRSGGETAERWINAHERDANGNAIVNSWDNGAARVTTNYRNTWHKYGGYWNGNVLRWYFDGVLQRTLTLSAPLDVKAFATPQYPMSNIWTGGDWVGQAPAGDAIMKIRNMRIWGKA